MKKNISKEFINIFELLAFVKTFYIKNFLRKSITKKIISKIDRITCIYYLDTGPEEWISKWRGHGTLTSIVGRHGWPTRKIFQF